MNDGSNRRFRQEDNRVPGSPDPSDLQDPSSSPSDLATPPRSHDSENAARSLDHFGNELYVDTTDNQTNDRLGFPSVDSRLMSDEISPLLLSPTLHMKTFTDRDVLSRNLVSPQRTVVSPESVGRQAANRVRTPRRQLTFRLPQSDQATDSESSLQTNLERLTIAGRTRRSSEQDLHFVEPTSPSEHQRRRRRHFSTGSAVSVAQQQQFRRLNNLHGGDNLLTVATQLGQENSQRLERRPQNPFLNSENGLLMNLERTTIGSSRQLPVSLQHDQQPFPVETQRRRRRHFTGSPRSAAQEQESMLLNELFPNSNDVIVASSQYPHDDESERPERRRHSLESSFPDSLQIVSFDQLLSSEDHSLPDCAHQSQWEDYKCDRHRNSAQGETRMDQSAVNSSRNDKQSNDETVPPYHEYPRECRFLTYHRHEQLSPKKHKSKHQKQSAVTPKKHCSAQSRGEPLQDIQNINDESEPYWECQHLNAEGESTRMYERFRVLLRNSLEQHANKTCRSYRGPRNRTMDEPTECTVSEIVDNFQGGGDRQRLRAERLSTSEDFCHPLHMDEYYEQNQREDESSHTLSSFEDEGLYYSGSQVEHQFNIVEAEHQPLQSVEEEPHPQLGLEEPHLDGAQDDLQHSLIQHHTSSEDEEEYRHSRK